MIEQTRTCTTIRRRTSLTLAQQRAEAYSGRVYVGKPNRAGGSVRYANATTVAAHSAWPPPLESQRARRRRWLRWRCCRTIRGRPSARPCCRRGWKPVVGRVTGSWWCGATPLTTPASASSLPINTGCDLRSQSPTTCSWRWRWCPAASTASASSFDTQRRSGLEIRTYDSS